MTIFAIIKDKRNYQLCTSGFSNAHLKHLKYYYIEFFKNFRIFI